ncbi:MAG: hypothetical protein AAF438_13890 [Pseudomonadota bacterium]
MTENTQTYVCKLAALSAPTKLCLSERELRVYKKTNDSFEESKVISLKDVRLLRQFREIHAIDEKSGEFELQRLVLYTQDKNRVDISSGYVTGNRGRFLVEATNQESDFLVFTNRLKERINEENPAAKFQSGWLAASVAWALVAMLGIGLLALGVAFVLFEDNWLSALLPMIFSFLFGGALTWVGFGLARSYYPNQVPLSKVLV